MISDCAPRKFSGMLNLEKMYDLNDQSFKSIDSGKVIVKVMTLICWISI